MATRTTHQYTGTLTIVECAQCHQDFGVLPNVISDRRRDHQSFYCPAGHSNYYAGRSTEEQLRADLAAAEGAAAAARARAHKARDERDAARRSTIAMKGVVTRTKRRAAAGVCPVAGCKRHFQNVQRHVERMHPAFADEARAQ